MKNNSPLHRLRKYIAVFVFAVIFSPFQVAAIQYQNEIPKPVVPVYHKLKNLYLTTQLVNQSRPEIIIVAPKVYATEVLAIQNAIENITGVTVSVLNDDALAIPLQKNVILLGNRSTNKSISDLYDRAYTFLDLKYPGVGGFVVRSLHNPFGNGKNVLFAGGSDYVGVKAAVQALIESLKSAGGKKGFLSVDYLAQVKLSKDYKVPQNIEEAEIWEASEKYNSTGYFGWNMISKHMALYYMTNEEHYLKEFLRLSFPNEEIIKEIALIDGELIENKNDPLAGPYHYSAHMMIEMWDLIEESPLLTDEMRLKITNAFARQLPHRVVEGIYDAKEASPSIGSRHSDWSAFSLYALGRYFEKDYPNPIWKRSMYAADLYFSGLKNTYWMAGTNDHLFWFTSFFDPVLNYLLLTGNRDPETMANLRQAFNTQQIIFTGNKPDWGLHTSSLSMLNKTAYILNEGRWLYYREHVDLDTNAFRLGQSYWPDSNLPVEVPNDLSGIWNIQLMPKEMWKARNTGFTQKQSFRWGSYRSELGAGRDFILIKGYNGALRNPYHSFDILELRLKGSTLLKGYHNQVITSADGMFEPKVAMDAALLYQGVVGEVTTAVAEVPDLAFTNWRRSLTLRKERYALIADEITFRGNSENILVETTWDIPEASWMLEGNFIKIQPQEIAEAKYELHSSEEMEVKQADKMIMNWRGAGREGEKRSFFHLLGENKSGTVGELASLQLTKNAAALSLPEAAIAVTGKYEGIDGELVLLSEKSVYGHNIRTAGLSKSLLSATAPIKIDWDFATGKLVVESDEAVTLTLALDTPGNIMIGRKQVNGKPAGQLYSFELRAGKQEFNGVIPSVAVMQTLTNELSALLQTAKERRASLFAKNSENTKSAVPVMKPVLQAKINGRPVNSVVIPSSKGNVIAMVAENTVSLLNIKGEIVQKFTTPGEVRVLRWWAEPKLLLVGCADEKVIAFDENGNKKWEFTSVMDPAVFEAGKQYWFKSAYPGVHGLYSGEFDNGKSRAFVGSAGTIEVLDEQGKLVKRLPVFWGNPRQFMILDQKDGSKNLLAGRWESDKPNLAIINSKEMEVSDYGYMGVPEGHTQVNGWMVMNRFDNFHKDMNGDGKGEIVSAINGSWNRITVYSNDGEPLYNVQFGPGSTTPRANIRMMDVADITADEKPEIVVALSSGFVNLFDGQTNSLWTKMLPSPPVVVKIIQGSHAPWICIGSEDGTIIAMDAIGNIISKSKVTGVPVDIQAIKEAKGEVAVITTDTGEVNGYQVKGKVSSKKVRK